MRRPAPFGPGALLRSECGVGAVELALVAPVLAFLIMGITDVAQGFSQKFSLEQAAYRALERAGSGSVKSDYSYLRTEAATAAGVPESAVTVETWLECDSVKQPAFDGQCTAEGAMVSRYVRVSVASTFRPNFNYGVSNQRIFDMSADGTVAIVGSAALRLQ